MVTNSRLLTLALAVWALCALCISGTCFARDPGGRYAQQNPELHQWFNTLKSGKGPCCADADGNVVKDSDWESVNDPAKPSTHYRVFLENEWKDVDDSAVVTVPNLFQRTMVWPLRGVMGTTTIRCFMPGSMT
jgi:hypothetical protein